MAISGFVWFFDSRNCFPILKNLTFKPLSPPPKKTMLASEFIVISIMSWKYFLPPQEWTVISRSKHLKVNQVTYNKKWHLTKSVGPSEEICGNFELIYPIYFEISQQCISIWNNRNNWEKGWKQAGI